MTSKLLFLWLLSCTYVYCTVLKFDNDSCLFFQGKISYYCREKYYCHMENAATEGLQKFSNDPVLKFFRAYAVILQGMFIWHNGFHHNNFIFKPFLNLYTANFKEYGRFLILHEYIIPQFNRFASNRENLKLQTPNLYI